MKHIIEYVEQGSIAEQLNIEVGDELVSINGEPVEDIFDYQYYVENEQLEVLIRKESGEEWVLDIEKDEDEDLGLEFDDGLMDECKRCSNKCIFCFIDQMPKGMRDTLYFKDDDSRLSFLQGNYITLTNMSDKDVDRIIKYNLSPINISFQTTNPELRCKMLNNRFAGEALDKVKRIVEAGLTINGQIVLCKGVNDKEELERSLSDLYGYLPYLQSLSVVPVGLTKYRDGLYPMEPFTKEDSIEVIEQIEKWQKKAYEEFGVHFVHASDEWYINAHRELPEEDRYDGYLQIENGVGMVRSMLTEAFEEIEECAKRKVEAEKISIVTGMLAYPYIKQVADRVMNDFPDKEIAVLPIRNDFFGEMITVTGLLTGKDIIAQCKEKDLGNRLLISQCCLKADEDIFLDDVTVDEMKEVLQVDVSIVQSNGYDLVDCMLGD